MLCLDAPIVHTSTYHKNAEIHFSTNSQGSLFVTIDTKRLHIRSIESTQEDVDRITSLLGDAEVMEKYHIGLPPPADKSRARIAKWLERWQHNNPYSALAVFGNETDEFLGVVVLGLNGTPGESQLSYLFHPRYWNQGYGTEAVSSLLEYATATIEEGHTLDGKPLEKVVATSRVDNPASLRILEKVGMQRVGTEEKYDAQRHHYQLELKSRK